MIEGDNLVMATIKCDACGKVANIEGVVEDVHTHPRIPEDLEASVHFPGTMAKGWSRLGNKRYCPDHKVEIRRLVVIDGVTVEEILRPAIK